MNVQKPTVGRIVHLYPNGDRSEVATDAASNGADVVPALVTQTGDGLTCNMHVYCNATAGIGGALVSYGHQIPHKSNAQPGRCYWDWPPMPAAQKDAAAPTTNSAPKKAPAKNGAGKKES